MFKKVVKTIICVLCILCSTIYCGAMQNSVYADSELTISAKAGFLIDYNSGEILFEKNSDEKLQIASMVKLMTIYLTLQAVDSGKIALDDKLVASDFASSMGGSQVFIDSGSSYSVEKMLESVIMASANDASVALAEFICGSEKSFVDLMNKTAKSFGMTNTLYANATGLPSPEQYSTARDTAVILQKILANDNYHKYSTLWLDELVHPSGRKTEIVNTNKLSRYYEGCDSGKTGFTDEAGYCLASSVKRGNMRLTSVVIGAKNAKVRFEESVYLFNWGFANFENKEIVSCDNSIATLNVKKSKTTDVKVFPSENFVSLVRKGMDDNFEITTNLEKSLVAPIKSGEQVGVLTITKNGVVVKEISIIVKENIDCLTFNQSFKKIIELWQG